MTALKARLAVAGPYIALVLAPLFWSGNVVVGRALREQVDPIALNLYRWSIAGVLLLPFALRPLWHHRQELRRHWPVFVGLGLTGMAGFQTCVYFAVRETQALNALLILQATPVVIVIGAAVLFGDRLRPRQVLAVLVAAAGALVLVAHGDAQRLLQLAFNRGDLWMLVAVVLWASYSLLLKRKPAAIPQTALLGASIVVGLAVLLPAWWLTGAAAARPPLTGAALLGVGYIGVFASFLAFLCWNTGVAHVGPGTAGTFMYLMPLYGAVLGYAFLGEGVALFHLVGAAMIFGGLGLMHGGRSGAD